jgi:LysR family transcriptional regulator, regulatory protein for tcuABC
VMLNARQIDLAILFQNDNARRFSATPLLDERLFAIAAADCAALPAKRTLRLAQIAPLPLILPSGPHGLRSLLNSAFARVKAEPNVVAEIDGLAMLMDAVGGGLGVTIQPGAALARREAAAYRAVPIAGQDMVRPNQLVSLSDDELSPAGLAARVVLADVARSLVANGAWAGATLAERS